MNYENKTAFERVDTGYKQVTDYHFGIDLEN